MNRIHGKKLLVWALGAGTVLALGALLYVYPSKRVTPAWAAMRIVIIDPDPDDQADAKLKTRRNGDGSLRVKFEADVFDVQAGHPYVLRLTAEDLQTGERVEATTPPLVAQPPR